MLGKALLYSTLICWSICPLYAAQMLVGNTKNDQTFTFNISTHALYIPGGRFFIGAAEEINKNDFAVAVANRHGINFRGLTPEKVRLNGQPDSINPLFGAAISKLALLGNRPLVAKTDDPSSLFLIESSTSPISVYAARDIHDAQGLQAQALLALTTSGANVVTDLEAGASLAAFAAVGNSQGDFDGDGSGIALLFFKKFTSKENKVPFFAWDSVDAQTGASQLDNEGTPISGGNRAFPIGKNTFGIGINSPVTAISKAVDLFFDRDLGKLYIALQVVGGAAATDGARGILVASLINGKLMVQPIASDTAFQDTTKIVGGRGPFATTTIFKVRTLQTTTYLRYLIVVGGNASNPALQQQVYALPLVDNMQDAAHGTLANVNSQPLTIFAKNPPERFLTRVFVDPAQKPADLYSSDSLGAQVGGDGILPGPITNITASSDAVFVSVNADGQSMKAGMFYSQAFFDDQGRIKGWTNWQRVAGSQEKIAGFSYDSYKGSFWYIPERMQAGQSVVQTHTVLRTEFTQAYDPLCLFISKEFSQLSGGVQGLFDFPVTTPSFTTQIGERIAVNAFTGFNKLILMQTGADSNGLFGPQRDFTAPFESTDGSLTGFAKGTALSLSGGALAAIGPIGACATVTDGVFGWFVVGGSGGVAILADDQGAGWDAQAGLKTNFQGLTAAMSFKKISDVKNVRKLISVHNNLFVLTDQTVVRLTIQSNLIATKVVSTTIAQLGEEQKKLSSSYSDLIVSGPLALIATSFGLLRSGNLVDIQTIRSDEQAQWKQVDLPEAAGSVTSPGPVSRLFTISPNGMESGVGMGGNIIAFNAYVGLSEAQLYRLALNVEGGLVTDQTVQLLPDLFIRNVPTFFANLGDYRNYVVTDGALIAVSRSAFGASKPLLELLPPTLKSGQPSGARNRVIFVNVQENHPGLQTFSMGRLLRDSASGSWMVPGDFGIRIQQ